MILRDLLRSGAAELRSAGIPNAEGDARRLLAHAAGIAQDRLSLHLGEPVPDGTAPRLAEALAARAAHQPVAQITGKRLFWGREFLVTQDVLDPRPETETLIAEACTRPARRILDLGTGTGCIGLTLLAEMPQATACLTDRSSAALGVARANAERLGLASRAALIESDWLSHVIGQYDLIVSNPPYISEAEMETLAPDVRDWEPHLALSPGGDGLGAYRALAESLPPHLAPGGRVLLEIGASQAAQVSEICAPLAPVNVQVLADLDGRDRVISLIF